MMLGNDVRQGRGCDVQHRAATNYPFSYRPFWPLPRSQTRSLPSMVRREADEAAAFDRILRRRRAAAGRDHQHLAAFDPPAALAVLVERAVGEHEFEAAVGLQQQLGTDFHHAVEVVVADALRVAGRAAAAESAARCLAARDGRQQCQGGERFHGPFHRRSLVEEVLAVASAGQAQEDQAGPCGSSRKPARTTPAEASSG